METLTYTVNVLNVFEAKQEECAEFFADTPYRLELNFQPAAQHSQIGILWHEDCRNRILLAPGNVVVKTPTGYVRKFTNREALNRVYGLPEGTE